MKKNLNNETDSTELNKTTELHIIDLDKLEDDSAIDYDKFSEEDHLRMDSTSNSSGAQENKSSGIMAGILKINWHLILLLVFVFSVIFTAISAHWSVMYAFFRPSDETISVTTVLWAIIFFVTYMYSTSYAKEEVFKRIYKYS